ncbi:MAG: DUF1684 domain-containing protein [Acidobacteriota bacterium]
MKAVVPGVLTLFLLACADVGPSPQQISDHLAAVEEWRASRLDNLTAEYGWLSLVGLEWLEEGVNRCGASPEAEVELPAGKAPEQLALIHFSEQLAELEVLPEGAGLIVDGAPLEAGQRLALASDAEGEPSMIEWQALQFFLIERGGRIGMRVKDRQSATRLEFAGIEHFPVSYDWRFDATFEPYDPPRTVQVPSILGNIDNEESHGAVVFEHDGETHRLDIIGTADESLFLVIGDPTNGHDTYGGGRFLYAPVPDADGRLELDFNRAYNPPCAFTAFSTCPLPPRQNKLPFDLLAGERYSGDGDHGA